MIDGLCKIWVPLLGRMEILCFVFSNYNAINAGVAKLFSSKTVTVIFESKISLKG